MKSKRKTLPLSIPSCVAAVEALEYSGRQPSLRRAGDEYRRSSCSYLWGLHSGCRDGIFAARPTTPPSSVRHCRHHRRSTRDSSIGIRATLSTNNLELVRGINGAGNLRDKSILYKLSSNNWRSFYYSQGRYFETSGISWVLALYKVLDQIFVVLASF